MKHVHERASSSGQWNRAVSMVGVLFLVSVAACEVSPDEEKALGDEYAAAARQQLRLSADPALLAPVEQLGRRIASAGDVNGQEWKYYVVDDTIVNAFAIPGGHVFVFRGLLHRAQNSSEVAGVLGHEIAHVVLRHSADQLTSRRKANLVVTLFCWVTSACESTAAKVAIGLGGEAFFAKHSRDDEREADSAAVELLVRAGIDPRGVPSLFRRLLEARRSDPSAVESWFSSHPLEEERITRTEAQVARFRPALLDSLERDVAEYPFGRSPR